MLPLSKPHFPVKKRRLFRVHPQLDFLEDRLQPGNAFFGGFWGFGLLGLETSLLVEPSINASADSPVSQSLLALRLQETTVTQGEFLCLLNVHDLGGLRLPTEDVHSLPARDYNDAGAVSAIAAASAAAFSRPDSTGLAEGMNYGSAQFQPIGHSSADLPARPIVSADAPNGAPGMETTLLTPYFGRSGPADHAGLLQAMGSVRGRAQAVPQRTAVPKEQIQSNYTKTGLSFERNVGQSDPSVQFLAHGAGYGLYLTATDAVMVLNQPSPARDQPLGTEDPLTVPGLPSLTPNPQLLAPPSVVRMQLLGGNPAPQVVGRDELPGKVNYFLGNDPAHWHTHISTFARVEYQNVYPGINLDYYGNQGQLEYDFVVAPGADPRVIHMGFAGADQLSLNEHGDLVIHAGGQDIVQHKPLVYQEANGSRQEIASAFSLTTGKSPLTTHEVGFTLGTYDNSSPLVIDPVLSYSTYLGGNGYDAAFGIAVDPATGDALVTGQAGSTDFPTANPFQPSYGGGVEDAFVSRLSADGSALVFSTYLGGSDFDTGNDIGVDPATGDILVTGVTYSQDFPTVNALQASLGGPLATNAFVVRLSADGSALVFSTYVGGSHNDTGSRIAVDPVTGDVLVTGWTSSTDFPTVNPALQQNLRGIENAFVARLSADGSALVYSTYLGGSSDDRAFAIAVDPTTGDALVTGFTQSTDFPTANPLQSHYAGGRFDGFVSRLSADGRALIFSTYIGGSSDDISGDIALDPNTGDILVTGGTYSTDFPTVNPLQPHNAGDWDMFVARLSADGSALLYSTYLGGSGEDRGIRIAVDTNTGDILVAGFTTSRNFPTANPLQANYGGGRYDAFVARLSADGTALVYSTYLGGSNDDFAAAIAMDPTTGDALVTGYTNSTNFPTANPLQPRLGGGTCFDQPCPDAFLARISP